MDQIQRDFLTPAQPALDSIHTVLKPIPNGRMPPRHTPLPPEGHEPWTQTANWVLRHKGLQTALEGFGTDKFGPRLRPSIRQIDSLASDANTKMSEIFTLRGNQKSLRDAVKALGDAEDKAKPKLQALIEEVKKIEPTDPNMPMVVSIDDLHKGDRNYQVEVWSLDYTNRFTGVAKRVAGDTYVKPNPALLAGLADPPAKQSVVTVTAQFEALSRLEISTGVLVPVTPYHSYTAAQSYSASAPVVQENKIYTVVPDASFNILLHELIADRQRVAFFLTGAIGYTPATSSVAFGVGPSFSWRSVVISPLADIGRDSQLTGGYTVGGSLGSGTTPAAAPQTKNFWDVKFAPGLSVRIPIGGASQ